MISKQEGNYMLKNKKFLASSITAVAVAAAFVPAVSADEVQFKDVSGNYASVVDFLLANGITDGMTDTEFGTYSSVKRVDAAVMIARVLGFDPTAEYDDAGFTDVVEIQNFSSELQNSRIEI